MNSWFILFIRFTFAIVYNCLSFFFFSYVVLKAILPIQILVWIVFLNWFWIFIFTWISVVYKLAVFQILNIFLKILVLIVSGNRRNFFISFLGSIYSLFIDLNIDFDSIPFRISIKVKFLNYFSFFTQHNKYFFLILLLKFIWSIFSLSFLMQNFIKWIPWNIYILFSHSSQFLILNLYFNNLSSTFRIQWLFFKFFFFFYFVFSLNLLCFLFLSLGCFLFGWFHGGMIVNFRLMFLRQHIQIYSLIAYF